jgi:hypothetical protein
LNFHVLYQSHFLVFGFGQVVACGGQESSLQEVYVLVSEVLDFDVIFFSLFGSFEG